MSGIYVLSFDRENKIKGPNHHHHHPRKRLHHVICLLLSLKWMRDNILFQIGQVTVWLKPLSDRSSAVAFLFSGAGLGGMPARITLKLRDIGLTHSAGYNVTDAFTTRSLPLTKPDSVMTVRVNPHGVEMVVAAPIKTSWQNEFYVVPWGRMYETVK